MFFDFHRIENYPTSYEEVKTAANTDVLEAGLILAFVILCGCLLLVLPAVRGLPQLFLFVRVIVSLFIGAVLLISNFGQDWETGRIKATMPYKAGQPHEIKALIGLRIGLRSINITLMSKPHEKPLNKETINYNERFWWTWDQGRFGFGHFAGRMQQDFRQAQLRGLPLPILWVAEYFTIDGEGLRWGRFYRTAGWYAHIAMWAAFPCWLLANFLFLSVIRYGAMFTLLTGALQVLACILWISIRNPTELSIPFDEDVLKTSYGVNFWLTLVTGVVCILIGILVLFFDLRYPDDISSFFGIDPLADYEEYHLSAAELEVVRKKRDNKKVEFESIEMSGAGPSQIVEEDIPKTVLKRRTTIRRVQKSLFRTPAVINSAHEDEEPMYLNINPRFQETIHE